MKIISILLISFYFAINLAVSQNNIQSAVEQFASVNELKHGSVSFAVIDLSTGQTIAEYDKDLAIPTASTAKLFSTATALELLGPKYQASTKLYYDGDLDSTGTLKGNIWIVGGGDPTLGSKYFTNAETRDQFLANWVNYIQKLGIKRIEGAIIGDASSFGYNGAPDGWNWSDLGNYYGAGPSGLTVFDNLVEYHFATSSQAGKQTELKTTFPEVPGLVFHNYVLSSTKSGDNSYIYGSPYSLDRFGTGTLPVNQSDFVVKGSLPDPEYQMAFELYNRLMQHNISVHETPKSVRQLEIDSPNSSQLKLIVDHKGKPLIDIITETNMHSINLFAEHMLTFIAYEKTGMGSIENGVDVLDKFWSSKINTEGMHINDGSGLSRTNAISAQHYVAMLSYMHSSKYAQEFKTSLPIAGVSGTLRSVCKGQSAQNRMYAKSGTMTRIKSYAGYIDGKSGKKYAFALIANNYECSSTLIRQKMEQVFNAIANQ